MPLTITSTSFRNNGVIPSRYTCDGQNVSPPLSWSGVPENAKSLILIVDDPDAPDPKAPRKTWVHLVLYNIPPDTPGLPEGIATETLPPGTLQGKNDWQAVGYRGPCPPIGSHRYFHKLIALNVVLPDMGIPTKAALETLMPGYIVGHAELVGRYQRPH
ncbi:MAG: YbhB/YbcL family Raf kinase inhibitor-like protein [Nitrosomonadales bacterium]|nr:YbhB/YbcL family Raf kinase inhibitor-like protein [Nitrosomonadales bacterium]